MRMRHQQYVPLYDGLRVDLQRILIHSGVNPVPWTGSCFGIDLCLLGAKEKHPWLQNVVVGIRRMLVSGDVKFT
jgi:hypothetical protein